MECSQIIHPCLVWVLAGSCLISGVVIGMCASIAASAMLTERRLKPAKRNHAPGI